MNANAQHSVSEPSGALQTQARQQQEHEIARIRSIARKWKLSEDEMLRAKDLLAGTGWPTRYGQAEYVKAVKALGIHARDEAERQKYARILIGAQRQEQLQREIERRNRRERQIMEEDFRRACEREAERLAALKPEGPP